MGNTLKLLIWGGVPAVGGALVLGPMGFAVGAAVGVGLGVVVGGVSLPGLGRGGVAGAGGPLDKLAGGVAAVAAGYGKAIGSVGSGLGKAVGDVGKSVPVVTRAISTGAKNGVGGVVGTAKVISRKLGGIKPPKIKLPKFKLF